MSRVDKYKEFMAHVEWDELSLGEKEALYEATYGSPSEGSYPFRVISDGDKGSDIIIEYRINDAKIKLSHKELSIFRAWLEDNYMSNNAEAYLTIEREKEKDGLRLKNNVISEFEISQIVLRILLQYCSAYRIKRDAVIYESEPYTRADYIIYNNIQELQMILEVKRSREITKEKLDQVFARFYTKLPHVVYVLTDGSKALVHQNETIKDLKFEDFVKNFFSGKKDKGVANKSDIVNFFYNAIEELVRENDIDGRVRSRKKKELKQFISGNDKNKIEYDKADASIFYLKKKEERKFIQILLGNYDEDYIVKFSSARSLYEVLNKGKIGMCSLVCMNDPSEKNYADDVVKSLNTVDDAADTFIISSCEDARIDDLTIWRLYADDAKGVGLKFKINKRQIRERFYLAPISYGEGRGKHWELEVIKSLIHASPLQGSRFVLKDWLVWKHFFKNSSYAIEKEIRLLYQPKDLPKEGESEWFMDDRTSVYSEKRIFDLTAKKSSFPLKLSQIILGSRFPGAEENVSQIKKCFERTKIITGTPIENIVDYRKFDYK